MKKFISLILSIMLLSGWQINADSNWRMHPTFDEYVSHVIDTPDYVYFTSRPLPSSTIIDPQYFLFRYDKAGDELQELSTDNMLAYNTIMDMQYNPEKGYIFVVYSNYDIDLIYDNGKVENIPYYRVDNPGVSRKVHSISSDPKNDRVYMATDFGYVAINDKKREIAESRLYGESLQSVGKIGDFFYALKGNELIAAPAAAARLSLGDYRTIAEFDTPIGLYPLNDSQGVLILGPNYGNAIKLLTFKGYDVEVKDIAESMVYNVEMIPDGILVTQISWLRHFTKDGNYTSVLRPESIRNSAVGTRNMSDLWVGVKRRGLENVRVGSSNEWTVTKDYMLPNAPAPFISPKIVTHPDKGLLLISYGMLRHLSSYPISVPLLINSYKNGWWTNHGPVYANPDSGDLLRQTNGIAVDPDNSSYVYVSSTFNGFARINLNNPDDIIHMSYPTDVSSGKEGFVALVPAEDVSGSYCNFSPPYFDNKGNLWMCYADWNHQNPAKLKFYCWRADDRKATNSASDIRLPGTLEIQQNLEISNFSYVFPIRRTGSDLLLYVRNAAEEQIAIIDTNGTPLEGGDDKIYKFSDYVDRDGNSVAIAYASFAWEDPLTNYIWMGHNTGVFYIDPSQIINGNYQINRIKVSRNDGTNLADYLLDGVAVYGMTSDSSGRKWFATGAGLICTSSDGREIITEFNTENSDIPSDMVFGVAYNSNNNSLMVSTEKGIAEYFLPAGENNGSKTDVKAYPNPVRSDFTGYVTITDIPEGSLVKIADSGGNLVKELGRMEGFELKWDISDVNSRRVGSGVYYILVSPGDENGSYSKVGKILVIS